MEKLSMNFIVILTLTFSSNIFAAQTCAEKREILRERLKECPNKNCKEKVKKLIQDLKCNEQGNNSNQNKSDKEVNENNSNKSTEVDCKNLLNLWTKVEPLKKEGNPDTTKHIQSNLAYREHKKGLKDLVDTPQKNSYIPIKNGALHDQGSPHWTNAKSKKDKPDIGAFELGSSYPQIGATNSKWNMKSTNQPDQAKKASVGYQPHKATWLKNIRSEQDDL